MQIRNHSIITGPNFPVMNVPLRNTGVPADGSVLLRRAWSGDGLETYSDPYQILVSEIMLQQTQVERVATKFPEFIETFPDFTALAAATLADVLTVWQGMGYNRRAVSLQKCAVKIMTEYHGILPADVDQLATFPGIGKATASSIAAFAFNMPVVFIETNIRTGFYSLFLWRIRDR